MELHQLGLIKKGLVLGVVLLFSCVWVGLLSGTTYLGKKTMVIDDNGVVVTGNGFIGMGGVTSPVMQMDVSGSVLFDGMLQVPYIAQVNNPAVDWSVAACYHLNFEDSPPVTQTIVFTNPFTLNSSPKPCSLFLLVRRNCPLVFSSNIVWRGSGTGTFEAPESASQDDLYGFVYDGISTYYGYVNLDFKTSTLNPGGR
jgi:hypothetical protein